jgi:hypothetical protein
MKLTDFLITDRSAKFMINGAGWAGVRWGWRRR